MKNTEEIITELLPDLVALRHDFHRKPELGFEEYETAKSVATYLQSLGLRVQTGVGGTGVIATLYANQPGPTLAIRACLDALEIDEKTGLPYCSEKPGIMHACGHDGNITIALGAAAALVLQHDELKSHVKFIFQPSEENTGGAARIIAAGGLHDPEVDAILTLHTWHRIPAGQMVVVSGSPMASSDLFELEIIGEAGHGAWPNLAVDPLPIAAEVVLALQKLISREKDPMKAAIISLGKIEGGAAPNIISQSVKIWGTVRTFDEDLRQFLQRRIAEVTAGITSASRATYRLDYQCIMPPMKNDPALAAFVERTLRAILPAEQVSSAFEPVMGCEEFSLFQQHVPGLFLYIGNATPESMDVAVHSPVFNFNDEIIETGVRSLVETALRFHEFDGTRAQ